MKKLEKIQQNKLISSYGGVGSIIETNTNGALLILPYDNWPCFTDNRWEQCRIITDNRLLRYVKSQGYQHLDRLIEIPTPDFSDRIKIYAPDADDRAKTVGAKFFPEWYWCHRCRRLNKFAVWRERWNTKFPEDNRFNDNEPACYYCSKANGNGIHRSKLQQVRFVMVNMLSGELTDIPFDKLWENAPANGAWALSGNSTNAQLYYRTTENNDGLSGIYIQAQINGENRIIRMSQIDANYLIKPGEDADGMFDARPPVAYKMAMRGSQSLYLPNIVRSLYIPFNDQDQGANTEEDLDIQEFRFLTNDGNYINGRYVKGNLDLIAVRKNLENLPRYISRITALERLKETSVLLSYNRLAKPNEQRRWYDVDSKRERPDMSAGSQKPFSNKALETLTWMPAVEAFGEGILFELNLDGINQNNRTVFAHTYCHIVMKEMEFQCGYPLTSLKEKIFIDNDNIIAGFLIYTIAGSEGSYGGLISLTDDIRIIKLIERGAERAKHCTNDPICINDGDAHCFACLDLPETSCCKFNQDLNRRIFLENFFPGNENEATEENRADDLDNDGDIDPDTGITRGVPLA